jgi:hypothetical protein
MTKQNDNTETVEIRLVVTGRPDEMKILAAKWMRSNKFEALDFLAQGKKPEIIAEEGASLNQIHGAKIESAAFFKYLAAALNAQIAVEKGEVPSMDNPIEASGSRSTSSQPKASTTEDDDLIMDIE